MGEAERGEVAARVFVSYYCSNNHETRPSFAQEPGLAIPELWDCPRCGLPAGQDNTGNTVMSYTHSPEGRALQDASGICEGAALGRRRGSHPRRGLGLPARSRADHLTGWAPCRAPNHHRGYAAHQRRRIHLVGVQAPQLIREALRVAAMRQHDGTIRLPRLTQLR